VLVFVGDDSDPYHHVREWWNDAGNSRRTPREHLFAELGVQDSDFDVAPSGLVAVGRGAVLWARESPVAAAASWSGSIRLVAHVRAAAERAGVVWRERSHLALRRGPYLIAAGLDESPVERPPEILKGRFVNLFDPELQLQRDITLTEGNRVFLVDLAFAGKSRSSADAPGFRVLASASKILPASTDVQATTWTVEGITGTRSIILMSCARAPKQVLLEGKPLETVTYDAKEQLLHIRFPNESRPRALTLRHDERHACFAPSVEPRGSTPRALLLR
jgi:hypothetical protein